MDQRNKAVGIIAAVIVVVIIIVAAIAMMAGKSSSESPTPTPTASSPAPTSTAIEQEGGLSDHTMPMDETPTPTPAQPTTNASDGTTAQVDLNQPTSNVKTFNVTGQNFSFDPKEIHVKVGDTVKINFTSKSGMHDWVIDAFNARTKQVTSGQSSSVQFVADRAGTFEYYCSVMNHRQMGMVGKLIVE